MLDLSAEEATRAREEGLHYEGGFDVVSGDVARVEAIVSCDDLDAVGSAEQTLRGLDWSVGPAVSDLVLGRTVIAAEPRSEASFETGGKYLLPLPAPVFTHDDALNVLATVYWPAGRAMQRPLLAIVQDKKVLASLEVDLTASPDHARGWVFTAIPCKDIPPGKYVLRLIAHDDKGRASVREAAFEVR